MFYASPFPLTANDQEISLVCTSKSGVATLIGYSEYTTPTVPPIKFLRQSQGGGYHIVRYSGACVTPNGDTSDCVWAGACFYDPLTGLLTSEGTQDCGGGPVTNCGNLGSDFIGPPNLVITRLKRQAVVVGSCFPSVGFGDYKYTVANQYTELSVEDTEAYAIYRASGTPGSLATASTEVRGAGDFSFNFVSVNFELPCVFLIPGVSYRATVELVEENYGGGSPSTSTREYVFIASGPTYVILDMINCPPGKQITVQTPTIARA